MKQYVKKGLGLKETVHRKQLLPGDGVPIFTSGSPKGDDNKGEGRLVTKNTKIVKSKSSFKPSSKKRQVVKERASRRQPLPGDGALQYSNGSEEPKLSSTFLPLPGSGIFHYPNGAEAPRINTTSPVPSRVSPRSREASPLKRFAQRALSKKDRTPKQPLPGDGVRQSPSGPSKDSLLQTSSRAAEDVVVQAPSWSIGEIEEEDSDEVADEGQEEVEAGPVVLATKRFRSAVKQAMERPGNPGWKQPRREVTETGSKWLRIMSDLDKLQAKLRAEDPRPKTGRSSSMPVVRNGSSKPELTKRSNSLPRIIENDPGAEQEEPLPTQEQTDTHLAGLQESAAPLALESILEQQNGVGAEDGATAEEVKLYMGTDVDRRLPSEDSASPVVKAPAPSIILDASPNSVLNVGPLLQWKGAGDNSGTPEESKSVPEIEASPMSPTIEGPRSPLPFKRSPLVKSLDSVPGISMGADADGNLSEEQSPVSISAREHYSPLRERRSNGDRRSPTSYSWSSLSPTKASTPTSTMLSEDALLEDGEAAGEEGVTAKGFKSKAAPEILEELPGPSGAGTSVALPGGIAPAAKEQAEQMDWRSNPLAAPEVSPKGLKQLQGKAARGAVVGVGNKGPDSWLAVAETDPPGRNPSTLTAGLPPEISPRRQNAGEFDDSAVRKDKSPSSGRLVPRLAVSVAPQLERKGLTPRAENRVSPKVSSAQLDRRDAGPQPGTKVSPKGSSAQLERREVSSPGGTEVSPTAQQGRKEPAPPADRKASPKDSSARRKKAAELDSLVMAESDVTGASWLAFARKVQPELTAGGIPLALFKDKAPRRRNAAEFDVIGGSGRPRTAVSVTDRKESSPSAAPAEASPRQKKNSGTPPGKGSSPSAIHHWLAVAEMERLERTGRTANTPPAVLLKDASPRQTKGRKAARKDISTRPQLTVAETDRPEGAGTPPKVVLAVASPLPREAAERDVTTVGMDRYSPAERLQLTPLKIPEPYLDIEEETPQAGSEARTPTLADGRSAKSAAVPPRTPLTESGTPKKASEGKGMTAESLVAKYIALEHKNALKKAKAKAEAKTSASLNAKEEELRALRARLSTLESSPSEPEAKLKSPSFSKAQKEISRLSALLEEGRAEVLKKTEEAEGFKERLGQSEEKLMTSEAYIFLLKERLESARKDTDIVGTQLGSKLRQRDDELEAAHNERDELLHRVLHTGLQLQEVQKQREAERRDAAVKEAALEVEVEKLTTDIAVLEEEKTATAQRLGAAFAEKDAQTARARRESDEMAKELEALGAIADVLQRELVKTGERARDLEAELRMAREEAKQQREDLRVQEAEDSLEEKHSELEAKDSADPNSDDARRLEEELAEPLTALVTTQQELKGLQNLGSGTSEKEDEVLRLVEELEASRAALSRVRDELEVVKEAEKVVRESAKDEAAKLLGELEQAREALRTTRQELDALRQAKKNTSEGTVSEELLEARRALLTAKLEAAELAKSGIDAAVEEREREVGKLLQELVECREALLKSGEELDALRTANQSLSEAAQKKGQEAARLAGDLGLLQTAFATAQQDLDAARRAHDEVSHLVGEKDRETQKVTEELEAFSRVGPELEALRQENGKLNEAARIKGDEVQRLSQELVQLQSALRTSQQEHAAAEKARDEVSEEKGREAQKLAGKFAQASAALLEARTQLREKEKAMDESIQEKDETLEQLAQELAQSRAELLKTGQELEALQKAHQRVSETAEGKEKEAEGLREKEKAMDESIQEKDKTMEQLAQELAHSHAELLKTGKELEALQKAHQGKEKEAERLAAELAEARAMLLSSQQEVQALEAARSKAGQTAEENAQRLSGELVQLRAVVQSSQQELEKVRADFTKSAQEEAQRLEELEQSRVALNDAQEQLKDLQKALLEKDREAAQVAQELADSQGSLGKAVHELDVLRGANKGLSETAQQLSGELEGLRAVLLSLQLEKQALEKASQAGQEEAKQLSEELAQSRAALLTAEQELKALQEAEEKMGALAREKEQGLSVELAEAHTALLKAQQELGVMQDAHGEMRKAAEGKGQEAQRLGEELARLQAALDTSQQELEKGRKEKDREVGRLSNECAQMRAAVVEAESQLESLRASEKAVRASAEEKAAKLSEELAQAREALARAGQELTALREAKMRADQAAQQKDENVLSLSGEVALLRGYVAKSDETYKVLQDENMRALESAREKEREVAKLVAELEGLRESLAESGKELQEAKERANLSVSEEDRERDRLLRELAEARAVLTKTSQQLRNVEKQATEKEHRLVELSEELSQLQEALSKSQHESKTLQEASERVALEKDKRATQLVVELGQSQAALSQSGRELEDLQEANKRANESAQEKAAELSAELAQVREALSKSGQELKMVQEAKQKADEEGRKAVQLAEKVTQLRGSLLKAQQEAEALEKAKKESSETARQLAEELARSQAALLSTQGEMEQLQGAHKQIHELAGEKDKMAQRVSLELEQSRASLLALEQEVRGLQGAKKTKESVEKEKEALRSAIEAYQNQVEQMEAEVNALKTKKGGSASMEIVNLTKGKEKRATTPKKRNPRLTKSVSSGSETLVDSDEEPVLTAASPKEDAAVSKFWTGWYGVKGRPGR